MNKPKYNLFQNTWYMIKRAWKDNKSVLWLLGLLVMITFFIQLVELLLAPAILTKLETHAPLSDLLKTIAIFSLSLITLSGLLAYLKKNATYGRIHLRVFIDNDVQYKMATTSYPNTEDSDVLQTLAQARYAIQNNHSATEAIWDTLQNLIVNLLSFFIYLFLVSSLNSVLSITIVIVSCASFFLTKKLYAWEYRHLDELRQYFQKTSYLSSLSHDRQIAKDIRIFGLRTWIDELYTSTLQLYKGCIQRREKAYFLANLIELGLLVLKNGLAYYYLIHLVLNGTISAAMFLLYFNAVSGFAIWVDGILANFTTLHQQSLDINKVRDFLETKELFKFEEGKPLNPNIQASYTLELKDVSFRYPHAKEDTLSHINLKINHREKLAIVGLNGAGKTTLVKLLCGFLDPTEGQVLLNSQDIKQYNRQDYYQLFSAVFQNFSILEASIAQNVAQKFDGYDQAKVIDALQKANLLAKVQTLPQQENTHLGKEVYDYGIDLSGGEMQRLMLARALYKEAPIIVLDEPTAALDPISENEIYLHYNEMTTNRMAIFISHRLASTRFCDRIILINDKTIQEEGTHEQLLAKQGTYAYLFETQSKYYQEGGEFHEENDRI